MAKVFAFEMHLWYFEWSASFYKRCDSVCILCVQFLDLYVKFWKKEAKFWKCVQAVKKKYTVTSYEVKSCMIVKKRILH